MRLSIITINRNNAEGLRKTIESVVTQTFTDFEYIIIDGASTDESVEIIKQYEDKISYWVSEPDKGIYNAMNKGVSQASGEYCLFLNSGDYLVENVTLESVLIERLDKDIVAFDAYYHNSDGVVLRTFPDRISLMYFYLDSLCHQATFIKLELFSKYGMYSEQFDIIGDVDFFVRTLAVNGCSYTHVSYPLANFMVNGISATADGMLKTQMEREVMLKKYFSDTIIDDYKEWSEIKSTYLYRRLSRLRHKCLLILVKKIVRFISWVDRI